MKFSRHGHLFEGQHEEAKCEYCGLSRASTAVAVGFCQKVPVPRETPETKNREDFGPLAQATKLVYQDRRKDYGTPLENHKRTAELWSNYLGVSLTARDVCMLNILQKVSRDRFKPLADNLVDIAGYAENAHLCAFPVRAVDTVLGTE